MKMMQTMRHGARLGLVCSALALTGFSAQAADTIKLGFIGPLSGGSAYEGQGARNGFLLAIRQANESGYPYKVEPVALDDASDPTVGVSAALKLANDREVVAAIGHWNSPVALATIPVFHRNKIPLVVWGAIGPSITAQNVPEVTRVVPTSVMENQPLANWATKTKGWKRFAIVSDTSDYGTSNTKAFTEYVKANGGTITSEDASPVGTTNFRPALTRINENKPDAVYFGGVVTEAALVRKQMADLGMSATPMLGISGIYDKKFTELTGAAGDGTIASVQKISDNPQLAAFNQAYEAAGYKEAAGTYAKYAYDATNILLEAIKKTGLKDKKKLAVAIRASDHQGAVGRTRFDDHGQTTLQIDADRYVVKGGAWQQLGE